MIQPPSLPSGPDWWKTAHNAFTGHRLFVLGNGPSLQELTPYLHALDFEYTIGVNLLHRWEPIINHKVTWYACSELDMFHPIDHLAVRHALDGGFITNQAPLPSGGQAKWRWVATRDDRLMPDGWFQGLRPSLMSSDYSSPWVASGRNVILDTAVQIGCWMGFDRIYLAGCNFTTEGHAYQDDASTVIRNASNITFAHLGADVAYQAMKAEGRTLAACTYSTLRVPKVNVQDVLRKIE